MILLGTLTTASGNVFGPWCVKLDVSQKGTCLRQVTRPRPPILLDTYTEPARGPTPLLAFCNLRFLSQLSPMLPPLHLDWITVLAQTPLARTRSPRKPTPFWERTTSPLPAMLPLPFLL